MEENVAKNVQIAEWYFIGCRFIVAKKGASAGKKMLIVNLVRKIIYDDGSESYALPDGQFITDETVANQIVSQHLKMFQKVNVETEASTLGARARIKAIYPVLD